MNVHPDHIGSLLFTCPCGCGVVRTVPVKIVFPWPGPSPDGAWGWDGNLESPTLVPSLQIAEGCRWHGYLTNGEWTKC